ncbi:ABC transporter permease subunit [Nocardiopsis aegyptia]|uniref:Peptide/nickel transport system permease protein n=1 Tax=Nocardiopsis aegyptia TaxID=220378 RepID=A0A7Z0EUE0_9ACTN|nr:ABC transporter permease subunit [Nocardiopsis aegyptia]NYJ38001.1 peptide/nickel transport system permease protein [Nocardiopsis aegyptia]
MNPAAPPRRRPARARRAAPLLTRLAALALITVVVGLLPWLSGRDPALSLLRARSAEQEPTAEALDAIRDELGLADGPLALLGSWFAGLLRGDLGASWISGTPVLPSVVAATGVSLTVMAAALAVALPLAAALCAPTLVRGARGTLRPGGSGTGAGAAALTALPEFLIAIVLMLVFAVWLGWLPPYGWSGPQHLILPALALGIPGGGLLGRLVDDALPAVFAERWVGLWTAAGCTPAQIAAAALRRATPALVPQLGMVAVGLTGGAVAVETIFTVPGIGRTALGAAQAQDLPVLQGSVLALVLLGTLAGVLAQVAHRRLLGRSLRDAALSLAPPPTAPAGLLRRAVPVVCAALLLTVTAWGLTRDALTVTVADRLQAPSWAHPLGTDAVGRDVLARLGHGAVYTVGVAALVCAISLAIALVVGFAPSLASGAAEAANAVPPVIAGILVVAVLGPGTLGASVAIALVSWPPLAAHAAALVQQTRAAGYLSAQRAIGAGPRWILWHHVLPSVAGPVARHAVLRLPATALALASLGFLGLGAQPPSAEWGLSLSESLVYVERAPLAALAPTAMLLLLAAFAVSLSTLPARSHTQRGRTP